MTTGTDNFKSYGAKRFDPAGNAAAITTHDTNELPIYSRAIYVGGAGDIVLITAEDQSGSGAGTAVTFTAVPAGTVLPVRARIVKATGTTATALVALY